MFHRAFFNSIMDKTPTHALFTQHYTGLFISPSGTYELDCATTKTDRAERSISIGTESLEVFFLY